jgi:hypothetical protein
MSRSYNSSPPWRMHGGILDTFFVFYYVLYNFCINGILKCIAGCWHDLGMNCGTIYVHFCVELGISVHTNILGIVGSFVVEVQRLKRL